MNSTLVDRLHDALIDEVYDGASGALTDDQFTALVRKLAETAAAVFEKAHTPTTPTDDEREAQGWREAALYDGDVQTQDDFMTGWRTADRTRSSDAQEAEVAARALDGVAAQFKTTEGLGLTSDALWWWTWFAEMLSDKASMLRTEAAALRAASELGGEGR